MSREFGQSPHCHTAPLWSLIYLDGNTPVSPGPAVMPIRTPIQRCGSVWRAFIFPFRAKKYVTWLGVLLGEEAESYLPNLHFPS